MYRGNEFWRPRGTTLGPPARIAGRAATRGAVNKTTTEWGGEVGVKKSSRNGPEIEERERDSE